MNHNKIYYRIGPHVLRIGGIPPLEPAALLPPYAPFVLSEEGGKKAPEIIDVDLRLVEAPVQEADDTFPHPVSFEWENSLCTLRRRADGSCRISIAPLDNPSAEACAECSGMFRRNVILIPEALLPEASFVVDNFLMMIYAFATAVCGTLMVHASVIEYEGRGYLFLGKSGTGKSTHARLWLKNIAGSRLLNDDNPVVAADPLTGQVKVYGTPWSGKTPCYLNKSVPVGAFVRLEQAPCNDISRLTAVRAFASILPSCSCVKQETEIYKGIIDSVTQIAMQIPVFHLKCLPDRDAAYLSMRTVCRTKT